MRMISLAAALGAAVGLLCASAFGQGESPLAQAHRARRNAALQANPHQAYDPGAVLVRFAANADNAARGAARAAAAGRALRTFDSVPGLELLEVGMPVAGAIDALRRSPAVLYAEPDYVVNTVSTPNDPGFGALWGMNNIQAPAAWDSFTGDANFVVAIIDDGTNYNHPDLAPNIFVNSAEVAGNGVDDDGDGYIDDVHGWDFYAGDNDPMTEGFHGTHTAGTVGAAGNNAVGVTGVNWQCKLLPLRFIGPNGGYTSDAVRALQYATRMGAKVSNNSWGGGGFDQSLYDAINASRSSGHIFVAAAGNGGSDNIGDNNDSLPFYPASYNLDNVISVAAIDSNDQLAGFSNYGSASVDLGAPGVNIYSCAYGDYGYASGTSMAAPHVAGVAALVYAANPTWSYAQVRSRILSTVRPIGSLAGRTVTGGALNAAAAMTVPANTAPTVSISSPANGGSFVVGAGITFSGSASDTQDGSLSSAIQWTSSLQGALGTGASFSRSDLIAGAHTITARVTDSGGLSSSASVSVTVTQATALPAAPTGTTVSVSNGVVTIRWTDNSGNETGFEVQRQQRVGNTWGGDATITTTGMNATSASDAPGTGKWRYRVRAVNDSGASAYSAWANANVH